MSRENEILAGQLADLPKDDFEEVLELARKIRLASAREASRAVERAELEEATGWFKQRGVIVHGLGIGKVDPKRGRDYVTYTPPGGSRQHLLIPSRHGPMTICKRLKLRVPTARGRIEVGRVSLCYDCLDRRENPRGFFSPRFLHRAYTATATEQRS